MTRPTILDMDLVVVPQAMTPEMIAAAWSAWHSRHGGKIGPGPAFGEAVPAAISASPYPTAWDDVRKAYAALESELKDRNGTIAEYQDHVAPYWIARAEAAEARIAELEKENAEETALRMRAIDNMKKAEVKVAELEKRLADADRVISKQRDALQPLSDAVFNDNGDITVNLSMPTSEEFIAAYFADRAARAYMDGK